MGWTVEFRRKVASVWSHPIFTPLQLQLLSSLLPSSLMFFYFFEMPLSFIYGSGSSSFSCLWIPFIPCFEVVCLVLLSTPPHSCTWRTRDKIEKQDVTICSQRVIPKSTIPCTGSNMQSWHRWWLTRTCRCTEWLFLEDRFKSWMT